MILIPFCACKATYFFLILTLKAGLMLGQILLSSARFYLLSVVGEQASMNSVWRAHCLSAAFSLMKLWFSIISSFCFQPMIVLLDDNKSQFFTTSTCKILKSMKMCQEGGEGEARILCLTWALCSRMTLGIPSFTCHISTLHPKERVALFVVVVSGFADVKVLVQSSLLEYKVFLTLCPIT